MTNNYLLFISGRYYPSYGSEDFVRAFAELPSEAELKQAVRENAPHHYHEEGCWDLFSVEELRQVVSGEWEVDGNTIKVEIYHE